MVFQSTSMDISFEILDVLFFSVLLIWVLVDIVRKRRSGREVYVRNGESVRERKGFALFTVLSNVVISVSYLGFGLYEYGNKGIVIWGVVCSCMTWVLATLVSVYCKSRTFNEGKTWPFVLIFWWVFSGILHLISSSLFVISHLKSIELPDFLPRANLVDMASLPLSIFLCFNALSYVKNHSDLEHPLLEKEDKNPSHDEDGAFSNAGIWSKVTFQWLNPLFKMGRTQKIELPHIPSVSESEKAENAFMLLEESLRKQKFEDLFLAKAIIRAIWKSLAINAIFAGSFSILDCISFVSNFCSAQVLKLLVQYFYRTKYCSILYWSFSYHKFCKLFVGKAG